MTLPPTRPRIRLHTRKFSYECFLRDDGLWDIDAELSDVKDYDYQLHANLRTAQEPIHQMRLRLTVDDSLTIRALVSTTLHAPFPQCDRPNESMPRMAGVQIGRGWRSEIEKRLGGTRGCTHLRDLLLNAGTAAIQSISAHAQHLERTGQKPYPPMHELPPFLDKCMTWSLQGDAVKQYMPTFFTAAPAKAD